MTWTLGEPPAGSRCCQCGRLLEGVAPRSDRHRGWLCSDLSCWAAEDADPATEPVKVKLG